MAIKLQRTKKSFSAYAGLKNFNLLLQKALPIYRLCDGLPHLQSGYQRSYDKALNLVRGFAVGAECLDDMGRLAEDPGFAQLSTGRVYTPKSYGDFLRSFAPSQLASLQSVLCKTSFSMRRHLYPSERQFYFDCDSTPNRQYGKKMEGVNMSHYAYECLDTLDVFDQFGLQYYCDVRPGNTHTAKGIELVVHQLMAEFQSYKARLGTDWKACFRADRGYYKASFLNACFAKNADVVIGVRQDENFKKIIGQVHNWSEQDFDDPGRIRFYDGRECEIGTTNFRPTGATRRLRYVVMRAKRPPAPLLPDHSEYDYFAFATTYSEQLMSAEEVILCYRKRGQAENYIKECKNGLDLKHYPCLKLNANRAYALLGALAYNLMRFMALSHNRHKPYYAKNIRFRWINIPCQVVRTGGDVFIRVMNQHYQEIKRWHESFKLIQFEYA